MYQPDLTAEHPRHQRMLEPLISLYQDGEANEEEAATVEQYLSACAECRAIQASFESLSGNLAAYRETIPAPRFDRRKYAFLDESPAVARHQTNPRARQRLARRTQPPGAATPGALVLPTTWPGAWRRLCWSDWSRSSFFGHAAGQPEQR